MWYVVDMLFAQRTKGKRVRVKCEVCNVLFEAPSALDACRKAMLWADEHSRDAGFYLVGIQHVRALDEECPGDGTEIGGHFFDEDDPWGRKDQIIPDLNEIPTVKFEANPNTPIKDLVSQSKIEKIKQVFGEE